MIKKLNRGVTLVEVMAALVIALVIAIGVMSYQYACAMNARKADMRSTASRLGLLLLDSWNSAKHSYPFNPLDYEPDDFLMGCGLGWDILEHYQDLGTDGLPSLPGLSTPFKSYKVFVNGTWFWVRLTYEDTWPDGGGVPLMPLRQLNAVIAWSDDVTDEDVINYDPMRSVILSKYAKVAVDVD